VLTVRAVRQGEEARLRELRIRALADAPNAFAATEEEESAHPDTHWTELARFSEQADSVIVCVAIDDERWIGMAAGRWFDRERGIVQLWGMWVDPGWRRRGVGERLVGAIRGWAVGRGARFVRLGVVQDAAHAGSFYERLGFVRTGETRPLTRDPTIGCFFLARPA
jgi:GNAT superfamily N-acetyltransferase